MKRIVLAGAILTLIGSAALAKVESDALIKDLASRGFTRVEVKEGLTQLKVLAIRGTEKLEMVLDSATGAVLKRTVGKVWFVDNTKPGFFVMERNRDFLGSQAVAVARSDSSDRKLVVRGGAAAAVDAPETGALVLADPARVTEDYVGDPIDVGPDDGALPDIVIDDGAFIDYIPAEGDPADTDGIGDGLPLEEDIEVIFIDDGYGGGWGIAIGEPYPIDGIGDGLPYEDDGILIGDGIGDGVPLDDEGVVIGDDGTVVEEIVIDDTIYDEPPTDDGTVAEEPPVDDGTVAEEPPVDDGTVDEGGEEVTGFSGVDAVPGEELILIAN